MDPVQLPEPIIKSTLYVMGLACAEPHVAKLKTSAAATVFRSFDFIDVPQLRASSSSDRPLIPKSVLKNTDTHARKKDGANSFCLTTVAPLRHRKVSNTLQI
jgi:hypothetical protein